MNFGQERWTVQAARDLGFLVAYSLFTTLLYIILLSFRRIPLGWTYLHIIGLTLLISLIGYLIERALK